MEMYRALLVAASSTLAFLGATQGWAANFVPAGHCAVVVASRPDVQAARQYIYEHGWQNAARVFESSNGWFAISPAVIPNDGSAAAISAMKNSNSVPGDAYCSTGARYVREVNWRVDDREPSRPVGASLWSEFDARPLTQTEKRFLQAALAMEGYYNGLLDGVWGNGSQSALERYTAAGFEGMKPANAHAAYLTGLTLDRWLDDGWDYMHVAYLDVSMMLPVDQLRLIEDDGLFEEWHHASKDLVVIFNDLDDEGLVGLHQIAAEDRDVVGEPYTLRGSRTWITSAPTTAGTVYVRSDLIAGSWSTVFILAGHGLKPELGLISGSIRAGSPVDIVPDEDGVLLWHVRELAASLKEDAGPAASPPRGAGLARSVPPRSADPDMLGSSTGTAFFVTGQGVALTNAHVVEDCSSLSLGGKPAEIVSISSAFDLAAVRLQAPEETTPLQFAKDDAALNSDITIAGYPLHGLLGGLNVGRGSVSSMKGLQGDETSIQISAPVQPGNSGGPAIDRYGGVVGVVVAKLNAVALADATGDIAQNVNFAIRGSLAKVFLSSNGIDYREIDGVDPIAPEKAAELLQTATSLVECNR